MQLLDSSGAPFVGGIPKVLSGTFCRSVFFRGNTSDVVVDGDNADARVEVRERLIRAQVPHMVTLLVYNSKFELQPAQREYFVYAPMDIKGSVQLAFKLWRRWEKPQRVEFATAIDLEDDYPKVEDAAVSEPIDDAFFDEMWRSVRASGKYKAAGHPDDPFAFTSLDPDIRVYKTSDFQEGLAVTV